MQLTETSSLLDRVCLQSLTLFSVACLEMGSKKKLAQKLEKAKHANSRRTLAVIRDIKKIKKREKVKGDYAIKVNGSTICPSESAIPSFLLISGEC